MANEYLTRSLRFPKPLWDSLDLDARIHKRSAVKHLEWLLNAYYREEIAGLKEDRLDEMKDDLTPREFDYHGQLPDETAKPKRKTG